MKTYGNKNGNSGVIAYESGKGFIDITFIGGYIYRYTYASAGKAAIDMMTKLAKEGKGLSTYISQHVKDKYAEKL